MKYIKTFEANLSDDIDRSQPEYYLRRFKIFESKRINWVVPLKMPDFIICLKKIGMNDKDINRWVRLYKNDVFTEDGRYPDRETITIDKDLEYNSYTWFWYPITKSDEYHDFRGKLECTPEEIQEYYDEIEMRNNIKKYNL